MTAFYRSCRDGSYAAQGTSAGPWGGESQHGGPPAALLARAVERLDPDGDRVVGRFTLDLLGPVPVGRFAVTASVVRPGRSVELREATLHDLDADRPVARAAAWCFPAHQAGPAAKLRPLAHVPADGLPHDRPMSWSGGYLDAVEWRWVTGSVEEPGPGVVWMRPRVPLVDDEPMSAVQRLMCCVDSASGVSAALDPGAWTFLNTELTVHVLRPPVGPWVCLDAHATLGPGSVGLATSHVYDAQGLVARSAQALLVAPRR